MKRRDYIAQHLKIHNRTINLYRAKVYKALQSQIKEAVIDLRHGGVAYAKGNLHDHDYNLHIGPVIMNLYKTAGIAMANRVAASLKKKLAVNAKGSLIEYTTKGGVLGYNQQWTEEIIAFFKAYLLEKVVVPISQTTKDFILQTLEKGVENGWGVDQIVKELETSDITQNRARLIVRTETTRATNYGGMMAAFNNDYEMEKEWLEIEDLRTRLSHRHGTGVGGEKIDLLDRFSNGLLFPGDPDGSAAEVCNCRCTLMYTPKRDDNGRLIPKKVIPASATAAEVPDEDINSSVIVNFLTDARVTLAQHLAESALQGAVLNEANKIIKDHLN